MKKVFSGEEVGRDSIYSITTESVLLHTVNIIRCRSRNQLEKQLQHTDKNYSNKCNTIISAPFFRFFSFYRSFFLSLYPFHTLHR